MMREINNQHLGKPEERGFLPTNEDFAWHERGLCFAGDYPADVDFFHYSGEKLRGANAVAYCKGDYYPDGKACPVIKQCLES